MKPTPNVIWIELAIKKDRSIFSALLWAVPIEVRLDRIALYLNRAWRNA